MFRNYLTIAMRNLRKHWMHSFINVSGLSLGICAALIIFLIVQFELGFDRSHPDAANTYRVVVKENRGGDRHSGAGIALPLIGAVRRELTGIRAVVPMILCKDNMQVAVPAGKGSDAKSYVFRDQKGIILTDGGYFDLTPYSWLAGSPRTALSEADAVVLTASRAAVYFPTLPPAEMIGRTIVCYDSVRLTVTGIVVDLKENTDFVFKEFISMPTASNNRIAGLFPLQQWGVRSSTYELFLRLDTDYTPARIERQLQQVLQKYDPADNQGSISLQLRLEPISELHLSNEYASFESARPVNKGALMGFLLLAGVLLTLACMNFINLTTARASQRAREIGIRKTLGGSRRQLIVQFLCETFLITALAAMLSLLLIPLVLTFFAPFVPPGLHIGWEVRPAVALFLILLVVVVGFLSGFYPAIVLSAFRPTAVLKGQSVVQFGQTRKSLLRRILSISQFAIAQLFLIITLGVGWQIDNLLKGDEVTRNQAILFFDVTGNTDSARRISTLLAGELNHIAGIGKVSLSAEPPTSNLFSAGIFTYNDGHRDIEANVQLKFTDTNYLGLYGISLLAGRNVVPSDTMHELVINETYARLLGFARLSDALNKYITGGPPGGTSKYIVVGVMRNFQTHFLLQKPSPVALSAAARECHTLHVAFRPQPAEGGGWRAGILQIEKAYRKLYPDADLKYQFFDESIATAYKGLENLDLLLKWATSVSIFISCLGMFGLVLYTTGQRVKEIGVRKVLGASSHQMVLLLSKDFMRPVLIASVIASSLGGIVMHLWLQGFSDRSLPPLWLFPAATIGMIGLALLILSVQTFRAATANPVEALRTE